MADSMYEVSLAMAAIGRIIRMRGRRLDREYRRHHSQQKRINHPPAVFYALHSGSVHITLIVPREGEARWCLPPDELKMLKSEHARQLARRARRAADERVAPGNWRDESRINRTFRREVERLGLKP